MFLKNITIQKILVPIDGSKPSYKALSHAVYIAQYNDAHITLLYVVDINHEISDSERVNLSSYIPENITSKGYELLAKLIHEIPTKIKIDISLEIGNPAEVIVNKAQNGQYDIIIMGNRGLSKIKSLFLGRVSQYVLRYAHCPVLITR